MHATRSSRGSAASAALSAFAGRRIPVAIVLTSGLLWWLCQYRAASLPFVAPWDFSFSWFYALLFPISWYVRGIGLLEAHHRPSLWRTGSFLAGMSALYIVLLTRFEYLAEHMFFLNRLQHVVMHHFGPFLIALAWPWRTIIAGMPPGLRQLVDKPAVTSFLRGVRQPFFAASLFVGLIALWLVPAVHFRAMIDPDLYAVMNWSMVIDGIFFWSLVLDPREPRLAKISFGLRAALAMGVMFPQILIGAVIALSSRDLYSFYAWCGRIYPTVSPLADQTFGGLIVWIPPAMMSVASLLLVLNFLRRCEEENSLVEAETGFSSASWTGRP